MINRLDTAVTLETPEGTEMQVHPAGLFVRGLAFVFDELIRWAIILVGWMLGAYAGLFGVGLALVVMFLTYWLYGVGFEVFNSGVTPGKKMMGLRVVHDDGTPIRLPASLLRNLVLYVDLLPAAYAAGIVTMLLTTNFRRLGDLAGGTMVIHRPSEGALVVDPVSGVRAPPFALTPTEQGVLVDFLERSAALTPERNSELAGLLSNTFGCGSDNAVEEIKRIANGLRGA
ncbi:MAG: RDD family protein [Gammaproteobacteria bacterium]|nr:RDD family protein [Gammaproteobacteria bacterium]